METMEQKKNFFTSLRHLSGDVDLEVGKLRSLINAPAKQSTDSCDPREALNLLRDINKDVRQLKANMIDTLSSIIDDGGLAQALPLVQTLLEVEKEHMDDMEAYLQRYGFTPYKPPSIEKAGTPDKSAETPLNSSNTPKQKNRRRSSEDDATPKLEDFGSPGFLERIYNIGKEQPAPVVADGSLESNINKFKIPTAVNKTSIIVTSGDTPMTQRKWSSVDNIPEQFQHYGIIVTPGVLGGRGVNIQTPTPLANEYPTFSPSQRAFVKPFRLDTAEDFASGSPVPPILRTPGLKQIRQFTADEEADKRIITKLDLGPSSLDMEDTDSPIPPILKTPGAKQIFCNLEYGHNPELSRAANCENTEDSPIPPVLMTPGIKQVQRLSKPVENIVSAVPVLEDSEITDFSPIPPILSCGIKLRKDLDIASSPDDSPAVPNFLTPGLRIKTKSHLKKEVSQKVDQKGDKINPAFTKYPAVHLQKNIYHDKEVTITPTYTSENTHGKLQLHNPRLDNLLDMDDPPTPQPPELTFHLEDLNTSLPVPPAKIHQNSTMPTSPVVPSAPRQWSCPPDKDEAEVPSFPKLKATCSFPSMDSKENIPPTTGQDSTVLSKVSVRKIKEVSLMEYSSQQDYIQRLLSLTTINETIDIFNKLLEEKVAAGKCASLGDADIEPYLGQNCKFFFLLMMKLRRVMRGRGSTVGGSYVVL